MQTEWTERQRTRLKELEHQFAQTLEKHEKEVARAIEAVKERELRAQIEKQTHRKIVKACSEAREEADSATVAHLSESQADLATSAGQPLKPVDQSDLVPGARIRVRGMPAPVTLRRRDDTSAEVEVGTAADEGRTRRHHGSRWQRGVREAQPAKWGHPAHAARRGTRGRRNQFDWLHGRGS